MSRALARASARAQSDEPSLTVELMPRLPAPIKRCTSPRVSKGSVRVLISPPSPPHPSRAARLGPGVGLMPRLPAPIKMNLYILQRRHAFFNFVVDEGEKFLELLARVNDLNNDGQVLRQPLDLERVHPAVRAKAHHAAHHGRAGQAFLARFHDNPFVKQLAVMTVALANKNPQQVTFFGKHHDRYLQI